MPNQSVLNSYHEYIKSLVIHYESGLLTLVEFKNAMDKMELVSFSGLIDPATGLKYP
jgi:hypothetical protein